MVGSSSRVVENIRFGHHRHSWKLCWELLSGSAGSTAGNTRSRMTQFGADGFLLWIGRLSSISLSFYPGRKKRGQRFFFYVCVFRAAKVVRSPLTRKQRSSLFFLPGEMLTGGQSGKLLPDSSFSWSGPNQKIWFFCKKKKK